MTREEKNLIRLQIISLLERCQDCQFRSVTNASIHVCPSCPIGQRVQALGKKISGEELARYRNWTKEEDAYLWNNQHLPRKELAKHLGRTRQAVINRLAELRKRGGVTHAS
ncbi:HTH domain-containing protein [Parageobacillus sp. VR-IP]|nr:HTH domain-containing protein [Parageobacillus sp. VR-IP]